MPYDIKSAAQRLHAGEAWNDEHVLRLVEQQYRDELVVAQRIDAADTDSRDDYAADVRKWVTVAAR